jgi:hypothetical protein
MTEIDETLSAPGFYANTPAQDARELEQERAHLEKDVVDWTAAWEQAEEAAA